MSVVACPARTVLIKAKDHELAVHAIATMNNSDRNHPNTDKRWLTKLKSVLIHGPDSPWPARTGFVFWHLKSTDRSDRRKKENFYRVA